jgi:hypothetical protein
MRPFSRAKSILFSWSLVSLAAALSCSNGPQNPPPWTPGTVYAAERQGPRGWLDVRGIIHAHSVFSHDACDDEPRLDGGAPNEPCFDDLRRGLCQARHDFLMLTDHPSLFVDGEFPDVLLYRPDRGDRLIERGGVAVANRATCPDGTSALVLAGCEGGTMPVGLEGHAAPDSPGRRAAYGSTSAEGLAALKARGAVVLVAHPETWTVDELTSRPVDGFEMYNLHANLFASLPQALDLYNRLLSGARDLPHPDLFLLPVISEDPRYVDPWGSVLSRGVRRVTVMATDAHRNTFRDLLADGERGDSYRRMMIWFSNHLLVRPRADGTPDDADLKDALRAGRVWGAFEILGYPVGFDFYALEAGVAREMGEQVSLGRGVELVAVLPSVKNLDRRQPDPALSLRLLRAREGGWDVLASSASSLRFPVRSPGAYRVEVRMAPRHLRAYLGRDAETLSSTERVWIYSNPIYVED